MLFARLTTVDNPFDPFDDFDKWNEYDIAKGYNSSSLLARLALESSGCSLYVNEMLKQEAIDTIVRWFPDFYKRVERYIPTDSDDCIVIPKL